MKPKIIVGSSIASLVAALEIAKLGEEVLLVKNSSVWGGHFSGIKALNHHFDSGMSVVELTSFASVDASDVRTYDEFIRNDVGRFFSHVGKYVADLCPLRLIAGPKTFFRGSMYSDFILCNSFDIFNAFTLEEQKRILLEVSTSNSSSHLHASNKLKFQDYHSKISYEQSSLFNHGHLIHEHILSPFINKLSRSDATDISSLLHRRYWLPLYYPETIASALNGHIQSIGNTALHYPENGSFASFAQELLLRLKSYDSVSVMETNVSSIDPTRKIIRLLSGLSIDYDILAWSSSLQQLLKLLSCPLLSPPEVRRSDLAFEYLLISSSLINPEFSFAFVADSSYPCYRLTNLSNCSGSNDKYSRLVVEYNLDYLRTIGLNTPDIPSLTNHALLGFGLVDNPDHVHSRCVIEYPGKLPVPSFEYEQYVDECIDEVSRLMPGIFLFGESSRASTRSFADNIIQGLKYSSVM